MKTILSLIAFLPLLALASLADSPPPPTTNPVPQSVIIEDAKLVGEFKGDQATFTYTATARVTDPKGGSLDLLSGTVALTEVSTHPRWRIRAGQNRFTAVFDRDGKYPIKISFTAAVRKHEGWKSVDFQIASSALQPIVLSGLNPETQFEFPGAARPEPKGSEFVSFLPADGAVKLSWKEAAPEAEGKLFYAAEMLSQISVSPGLMRQAALLNYTVMQGELSRVTLMLRGAGEVTRVQGNNILSWNLEPTTNASERRLVLQFNQPQKDQFALQVQIQSPLGAFPQVTDAMELRPEQATRFAGYFRVVNEGAVRLEVTRAQGLSQISPDQFPETDLSRAVLSSAGKQRFVYRFSSPEFALRIQADQILPELAVSQILAYHLGENELSIDAEIELDIREAPLRELSMHVPKGYVIARLTAAGLADYFLRDIDGLPEAELRLVFASPVTGRQVVQLRLERNQPLSETSWALPRLDVQKAKSVRGQLAAAADAGFRLSLERSQSLSEVATAFFPRKVTGIQAAFRITDANWQASVRIERLPQTVQADSFHLFSIGEGIAYGSSVLNYVLSGAPVSVFKVDLSDEYYNVEFTGKDIRNWQKTTNGYIVRLHSPVSGAYALLATYERPFKPQGETLAFTGARPLEVQSEQGYTVIISSYQFQVKAVDVSAGLLPLETAEVPSEYRLLFDAPVLAAYRYSARPFNLKLALSPLSQGDSLSQVVDRASLRTRISKAGQVLTDVRYFVKNRGNTHFRLTLPQGAQLWSVTVNAQSVVPVLDRGANLIPLPQRTDPDAVLTLDLKIASRSQDAKVVAVGAPVLSAPVMLAEWKLEPDAEQRLVYRDGSLSPIGGSPDVSGFAELARTFTGDNSNSAVGSLFAALALIAISILVWRGTLLAGSTKSAIRNRIGLAVGAVCLVTAAVALVNLWDITERQRTFLPRDVSFLAPVQQSNSALKVEVSNLPEKFTILSLIEFAWPALAGIAIWIYGWRTGIRSARSLGWIFGWLMLIWAALRCPNGGGAAIVLILVFLTVHFFLPSLRQVWRAQAGTRPANEPGGHAGTAPALTAWLLAGLVWWITGCTGVSAGHVASRNKATGVPGSVIQEVRIEDKFAIGSAKIHWQAEADQVLPFLSDSAVLTRLSFPTNSIKLVPAPSGSKRSYEFVALKEGTFDIDAQYQMQIIKGETESGFTPPLPYGLVNRLKLTVTDLNVDVLSPQAVSIQRENVGTNTVASLVLSPANGVWIAWKPRSRNVQSEMPVFYAELSQLYAPTAGVIEGAHFVSIRPAQGELAELVIDVPKGATITDVIDPGTQVAMAGSGTAAKSSTPASIVSLWRFDPDAHKLRVTLNPPQSRPFTLIVRSQVATGPLPFEHSVGLLTVEHAASQIGLLGIATGNDVQLDSTKSPSFSPINLEDFPAEVVTSLQCRIPGAVLRRAFRYAQPADESKSAANSEILLLTLGASAVEPDVRVETHDTLSLGEDRVVLASEVNVEITRAGIFRISFQMPAGFDVESISGAALSHWTELRTETNRVITLHLAGKTEGKQQFTLSLAAPGLKSGAGWAVPQINLREATKQRGTLVVAPEQGMRLQVATREGVTQLDPQKSGIRQKGVLAFNILQNPWSLALDIEQVDPWVQVTDLQHASVNEAQVKVTANFQYQIENTGLKSFRVLIATNAESVRFQGEQVADFLPVAGSITNDMQLWEVKLHRRVIGTYLLQISYNVPMPTQAPETVLRGIQVVGANLQRGFVTVQSTGRLQVQVDSTPATLQPAEWQSIPQALQKDLQSVAANFAYRFVDPAFQLPLRIERHDAVKLLPARVNNITFTSVISDDGVMLTRARLEMLPGDKRLLNFTLPKEAHFWFAYVNQNGVWPWREQDRILIPLEPPSRAGEPIAVELFYTCRIGSANSKSLDLELLAPKFDLPLEDITWRVSLNDKWKVSHTTGSLQLQQEEVLPQRTALDTKQYLDSEAAQQRDRTKAAEFYLNTGNSALEKGDPQQARRAFQAAYGLSAHDAAFNEDARVQLHNLKLQQTLVGLNVRQAATAGDATALGGKVRDLRSRKELNYTQQDAKDLIEHNSGDENAAFMRLAERLIQQQDAAASSPAAIHANIPEQGRLLTFKRSVAIDNWADLKIRLEAKTARTASGGWRLLVFCAAALFLAAIGWARKSLQQISVS